MSAQRRVVFLRWIPLLALWAGGAAALDTLVVGAGTEGLQWTAVGESSSFLNVAADSVWTWAAAPGANLGPRFSARGGRIGVGLEREGAFGVERYMSEGEGLDAWLDGDGGTAWSPDDDGELDRQLEVYVDLGGTFRVNRIRLFPRLDSEHRGLVLGSFELGTNEGTAPPGRMQEVKYRSVVGFSAFFPNKEAVVDRRFPSRDVRYIRLRSQESQPWEIAELEVYGDGTAPDGEFISGPLFVRGGFPIWGRVLADGRSVAELPLQLQTRTGPDDEPLHYYVQRGQDLERVSFEEYQKAGSGSSFSGILEDEQGLVLPNPEWSPWQTVTDGSVLSPGPRRYLQFRLLLSEPGTVIERLGFEYVRRPLAQDLAAEISPLVVPVGEETEFVLSIEVHTNPGRGDTGFRYLQVLTPAVVHRVEHLLVDDEEAVFTPSVQPGQGFTVDVWRRVVQSGSFVQLFFRASVLRDGTPFRVQALDLRPGEGGIEEVYQTAREGDVDPLLVGGQLVVRLEKAERALVGQVMPRSRVLTPDGDGVNDQFEVSFNLLKVTVPTRLSFAIFAMSGRRVRLGEGGMEMNGRYTRLWDGRDDQGALVPPGLYLYRIRVEADAGAFIHQGTVGVLY